MGLAVVHGIVKSYGGDIAVQSEIGKGTTFQIYLPRIESESESEESLPVESVEGGHERILIVDDEVQIVRMLEQMLEHLGYRVTGRTSSIEALQAFETQPDKFDLIVTDQTDAQYDRGATGGQAHADTEGDSGHRLHGVQ